MEEQKSNSKEIKMQPMTGSKQGKQENPPLPYDKLKEMADSLWNENRYLKQQLQGASETLRSINRLDYLLRVIEIDHNNRDNSVSFATAFVEKCIEEVQELMTPPEKDKKKEEKGA